MRLAHLPKSLMLRWPRSGPRSIRQDRARALQHTLRGSLHSHLRVRKSESSQLLHPFSVSQRLRRVIRLRIVKSVLNGSGVDHLQLAALDLRNELPAEALMRLADELLGALGMLLAFGE